jgi:hypothetical protein
LSATGMYRMVNGESLSCHIKISKEQGR